MPAKHNAMGEPAVITPRWGSEGRDRKAQAILRTLVDCCGSGITQGHWIDVGCGSGGIAATLATSVQRMSGFDPEPWPNWASMAAAHTNLSFTRAGFDIEQLPVPENSADVVICNQVYEHVERPKQLIRNIHRVLKPGGVCYFAGPNLLWPIEPHVHWPLVHWIPRRSALSLMRILGSQNTRNLDAFSSTAWTLERWFQESGLAFRTAMRDRLAAQHGESLPDRAARLLALIPNWVYQAVNPAVPGFVYLLQKSQAA